MSSFCKLLSRVSRSRARTASRARARPRIRHRAGVPDHRGDVWVPYKPTVGTRALRLATRRSKFALGPRATSPLQSEVLCDRAVPAARAAPSATRLTSRRIFVCTFSHNSKRWGERGADARAVAMFEPTATTTRRLMARRTTTMRRATTRRMTTATRAAASAMTATTMTMTTTTTSISDVDLARDARWRRAGAN